jgi:hypothetical protein
MYSGKIAVPPGGGGLSNNNNNSGRARIFSFSFGARRSVLKYFVCILLCF